MQCSSEIQTNMSDLQLQTLISKVAHLENQLNLIERKLDTHITEEAANNSQSASDSATATCCETSQATIWKPTSFTAMFELMNNRILQLESQVASTTTLRTVIDDKSNTSLQNQDRLARLESQFDEHMADMQALLEMATSHSVKERGDCSATNFEQNSTVSITDQLQTVIKAISQEFKNSPIDKYKLLKGYLDNMAVCTSGSTTTTTNVLSKYDELVEMVGILAKSSISAERCTRLEMLVDSVAKSSGKSDECIDSLKKQVKTSGDELKRIIRKEKELNDKCTKFQALITEKTNKKSSKTERLLDTQLLVLNAMSNKCKACKAELHELSTAINKELRESLFQIVNTYLLTELEHQLSKSKLDSAAAHNVLAKPSIRPMSVPEIAAVSKLSKIKCVLVGDCCTGKSTICNKFMTGEDNILPTIFEEHSTEFTVDGVCYNLILWDTGGYEGYKRYRKVSYKDADVVLICCRFNVNCSIKDATDKVTSYWIPEVRQHCPKTPIVLVRTSTPYWKTGTRIEYIGLIKKEQTFRTKDGMRLAKQNHVETYVECSFYEEEINAVFVAAVRAAVIARAL